MKTAARLFAASAAVVAVAALPALGAWEELRKNDTMRLSIDASSIRKRGDEVAFKYLVDFRQTQGDFKTAIYRSLTVKAAIRCKAQTISLGETEVFGGTEAKGPASGVMKPTKEERQFKKIEDGTSDEDLHKRVCAAPTAKAKKK